MTRFKEIQSKGIITKSKLPDANYVINPYTGCEFGCAYCYASFMGRFVDEPIAEWGNYVFVKANAVELARAEIDHLIAQGPEMTVLFSSVTDPYQGAESKYRLTRGILEIFVEKKYPGTVGILTKSALVTRDIDLFKALPKVDVGMTITTTDDAVSRFLEVRATSATRRLRTLKELNEAGLPTYAFVGPLLPHFVYREALLNDLFAAIADTGTREIYVEHMNIARYILERLLQELQREPDEVKQVYINAEQKKHKEKLTSMVGELLEKHGLRLRLGQTIEHKKVGELKGRNPQTAPTKSKTPKLSVE
ncbi:MAG: radical SAM protein [Verrucomicrobia bacterium]|nr:radical SAM protein [Verrucomicrobiota bacterium]